MGALAQGDLWFKGQTKSPWPWSGAGARRIRPRIERIVGGFGIRDGGGAGGLRAGHGNAGLHRFAQSACGTVGLRPTYGRVSRHGAMALSWTMDKIGPICRGVEDCAIVLNAIYGPDGHDRTVGADPFHWEPRKPLAQSLRVGLSARETSTGMQGDRKKIYDQALEDLKKAGVSMTPVEYQEDCTLIRFLFRPKARRRSTISRAMARCARCAGKGPPIGPTRSAVRGWCRRWSTFAPSAPARCWSRGSRSSWRIGTRS